jgi:imidazolonepropionase-like amidohydrolase
MYLIKAKGIYRNEEADFKNEVVVVDGEKIVWVGEEAKLPPAYAKECQLIDLSTKWLLPGLVNTHVHLEFDPDVEDVVGSFTQASPEELQALARRQGEQLLLSGVTTARDAGSSWHLLELGSNTKNLPRLIFCGPPVTIHRGHLYFMGCEAQTTAELKSAVKRHYERGATSLKIMATGGQVTPNSDPVKAAYSVEQIKTIVECARQYNLPTLAHCLTVEGFSICSQGGVDCIEHNACFVRSKESGRLEREFDPEVYELDGVQKPLLMIGVSTCYNLLNEVRSGLRTPTELESFKLEQEEKLFAIVRQLIALGYPFVIGTDAGVWGTYFDETHLELTLMGERAGMGWSELIYAATEGGAKALGLGDSVGVIGEGYLADLIALEVSPKERADAFEGVCWVMKGGEIVSDC